MRQTSKLSEEDRRALQSLVDALSVFVSLKATIPARHVQTCIQLALDEGHAVKHYAKKMSMSESSMSRALLDLGKMTRKRNTGLLLVEDRTSPTSLREHQMSLTPKGNKIVDEVIRVLQRRD